MTIFKWFASVTLVTTIFPVLQAEPHCPENVDSLRLRSVQRSQIIAPVVINHTGPYDFLVDTGTQITMVDPSLAAELHLKIQGTSAVVVGVGLRTAGSLARLDFLEAGSRGIANPLVVVQNLENLKATDPHIRGILGGNFLGHFDVLIDNAHSLLCLDDAKLMRQEVKGEHIALVTPTQTGRRSAVHRAAHHPGLPIRQRDPSIAIAARFRHKRPVPVRPRQIFSS
jgi:hypothetical protein